MTRPAARPLEGTIVLDVSRMLPGAVAARTLLDLGARVIKVEVPRIGDPMRFAPPQVDGMGAAFRALYRGAESICLDLKRPGDAEALCNVAGRADVMLESFRPGTLAEWGIDLSALLDAHPALTVCSLTSYGRDGQDADRVAHDINLVASSGLLSLLPGEGMPRVQIADVTAGLLAVSAILASLVGRAKTGRGGWIDQPLSTGTLPFLAVITAERSAGGGGIADVMLSGASPAYRLYTCADGRRLAVGLLEPKFWDRFVDLIGLSALHGVGLDAGTIGQRAAERIEETLATKPRDHWLGLFESRGLPVSAVLGPDEAETGGGPFLPSLGSASGWSAPGLGEHTSAVLSELGAPE